MVVTQASTVTKIFLVRARQAELSITPATHAFVLEASERETTGWIVMR